MTLQRAIESGKPFRRPSYHHWLVEFQGNLYKKIHYDDGRLYDQVAIQEGRPVLLLVSAAIADDWITYNL